MIEIVTPTEYIWPTDGYDHCESCNYLSRVHTAYGMDDGSRVVPLCLECATEMGVQ
jgi:hypothetical protein